MEFTTSRTNKTTIQYLTDQDSNDLETSASRKNAKQKPFTDTKLTKECKKKCQQQQRERERTSSELTRNVEPPTEEENHGRKNTEENETQNGETGSLASVLG